MTIYDIGYLSSNTAPHEIDDYTLSPSYPTDIFEFDIYATSNLNLALDPTYGDADLRLYFDSNNNGILDSSDRFVAGSYRGGSADDSINLADQGAGTYFARVSYFSSSSNYIQYDLNLSATPAYSSTTPSNVLPTEVDLGNLDSDQIQYGWVGDTDTTDTYYLELGLYEGVEITLSGLSADADIRLIEDSNNNGVVDAGEEVTRSQYGGIASESITQELSGNYFLQVYQFSGETNYTLNLDHYDTSYDIGYLSSDTAPYEIDDYTVSASHASDAFEFDLYETSNLNLALDPTYGDADLELYFDSNNNGTFDSTDQLVASSYRGGSADDSINLADQGAGTYFAQVSYFSASSGSVQYDLDLSATPAYASTTPSNVLPTEVDLGNLDYDRIQYGWVGDADTTDTYYLELGLYEGVEITLSGLSADADIRLIEDSNNNGIVDAGEEVTRSQYAGITSESITEELSGSYFLQVYQFSGETNYTLNFDHYNTSYA